MTALEFLYRLKNLSPESRLALAHLGALFEMLSPVLTRDKVPALSITLASRLTDETQLAASLGEPVSTVQGWYPPQQIAPNKWYRLGSVMEWITAHIAPIFSDDFLGEKAGDFQFSDIAKIWKVRLPALRVGDDLIGFFRSVREEVAPTSYSMVSETVLALRPSEMGKDALKKLPDSLTALAKFNIEIETSPSKAKELFLTWKDAAIAEVLLQFFRSSLAHDIELAKEIGARYE